MFLKRTLQLSGRLPGQLIHMKNMSSEADDVIFQVVKNKGIITLNRPKALNALNLSMVQKIKPKLQEWEKDKTLVLVKGTGDKAFCSGGDVRAVVKAGLEGSKLGHDFFRHEYTMNGIIGSYKIPYVAFIDGIVMGGGVGLSVHGKYRVATERTLFAMPETQIGLFPDVGGSYFLSRLNGKLGMFLALTGYRLKGQDLCHAGIATNYCESNKLKELEAALLDCNNDSDIKQALETFKCKLDKEFTLTPYMEKINHCFGGNSVEEIYKRLNEDGSDWAKDTLKILNRMSPTSLKVSHKVIQLGGSLNLHECLQMEYRVAVACLANHDFYEGVRALLIDKDQKPVWKPSKLEDVSQSLVDSHFEKLPEEQELKHKL